jgi:mono/diheme cytochrome c family protein
MGKFKFKSTPLRQAPTHADLMNVLKKGIPGTAMPAFHRLEETELESLADYVRYLSIRGQTERYLISELAQQDNESILSTKHSTNGETSAEQLNQIATEAIEKIGEDVLTELYQRWQVAESKITPVSNPPSESKLSAQVESGRTLYFGKGNCAECHGDSAGPVATKYYDDWTSDWIKSSGIDIERKQTYRDFLKAGALPPRTVRPRNLQMAVMRGGEDLESIYRKIANGIEGTPMPSSAATLSNDEIWALVAYVRSLGLKRQALSSRK